jgi:hypothetical protein
MMKMDERQKEKGLKELDDKIIASKVAERHDEVSGCSLKPFKFLPF